MNDKFERTGEEADSRHYDKICDEGRRKTTENVGGVSFCYDQDSKGVPLSTSQAC
jgi:hypothetical protein